MPRIPVRLAAVAACATVLAVTALSGSAASAATATTAPTGSLVIQEDNTFLQQALSAGIVAVALPSATAAYNSSTGFSATFPVTAGKANFAGFYGNVQVGGSVLLVNFNTGKTVIFNNLAFSADAYALTGVPMGETAAVNLLDPANITLGGTGATQTLQSDDLEIDPQGATYLDQKLGTSFFVAGQHTGTVSLTFTAGS